MTAAGLAATVPFVLVRHENLLGRLAAGRQ
jgi:hypothetical protein